MPQHVKVTGVPGYVDEFRATLIPGLHEVPSNPEPVSVISTEAGEILAVPSRCVEFVEIHTMRSGRFEYDIEGTRSPRGAISGTVRAVREV